MAKADVNAVFSEGDHSARTYNSGRVAGQLVVMHRNNHCFVELMRSQCTADVYTWCVRVVSTKRIGAGLEAHQ